MSIPPSDNYIGEPGRPDPWTTTRPREGLRDTDEARIVSLAPDVCWTPRGKSVVAVCYPVVDFCGHDQNYTPSVRFTGQKAMVLRSKTTHVHGDAPGTKKGIKSGTVEGICEPIEHAAQVRAEGSYVIRNLDRFRMNDGNTEGEAIFVRDTKSYPAPKDDDPLPGSLRWSEEPILLAQAQPVTVTDAGGAALAATKPNPISPPANLPHPSGQVIRPNFPHWSGPPGPSKSVSGAGHLLRLGKFGLKRIPLLEFLWPSELGAPLSETIRTGFPRDSHEFDIVTEAEQAIRQGAGQEEAKAWAEQEILRYRQWLADNPQVDAPAEEKPQAVPLADTVRISSERDREETNCPVGPHSLMQPICARAGRQAHHIVPDRSFRAAGPGSRRVQPSPSYGEGLAVCVESNRMGVNSEHSLIHNQYYDPQANLEAANSSTPGFITLSRAEDLGSEALEKGTGGRCNKEIIREALIGYHRSMKMEPDLMVRGQKGPLSSIQESTLGRQGGIGAR